ncbi:spore protease YyaC [Aquibacillus kalidii]|uniref:spore protease YyaC n=1 Tax=Aquibacillus kalidii TaxID=2762597 RepID=UPI001645FB59|nr:spore protease YyaC [Aquibacillus kalidii]
MNLRDKLSLKNDEVRCELQDPSAVAEISNTLFNWLPSSPVEIVIVCIGTDRSTGDSLGPLTGTLLNDKNLNNLTVYGTLKDPVHAKNLEEKLKQIYQKHNAPFVIAIDACLGKVKSIGSIITKKGPIRPGAALNKDLPGVGDVHLSAVVNISGFMEYLVLQNTRLHIVMQLARKISNSIYQLDRIITLHTPKITYKSESVSL